VDTTFKRCSVAEQNGKDWRVKAEHPRRPGTALEVTARDGRMIAVSGETCERATAEELASMIKNGYVERVVAARKVVSDAR
jgi:xanthine/CO dehydrogenase XdhC/CoxF family maturation factor